MLEMLIFFRIQVYREYDKQKFFLSVFADILNRLLAEA